MIQALHEVVARGRRQWRQWQGIEPALHREVRLPRMSYGKAGARWTLADGRLGSDSIVYSFGVGQDISFDRELIAATGATIHAFDPTPRSLQWISAQKVPDHFVFHPVGLHALDGELVFCPPAIEGHVSYSVDASRDDPSVCGGGGVKLAVKRLSTLMDELGHERLDLVKMDIEGSEYAAINDILAASCAIDQILVEFHHRLAGFTVQQTTQALARLQQAGYKVFSISPSGQEVGLIADRLLQA